MYPSMQKLIIYLLILCAFNSSTCKSLQHKEKSEMVEFIYCGKKLVISDDQIADLLKVVKTSFAECSDIYELIVTRKTIDDIRKGSSYLEISFYKNLEMSIGTFQKVNFTKLLIPLSGRFAANDQLTFFFGNPDYSSGPFVNKTGRSELIRKLESVK